VFKQLTPYRLGPAGAPALSALVAGLDRARFQPCTPTQALSTGWVPPRAEDHAPLVEVVAGQWLLKLCFERRLLPASVVRDRVEARALQIERDTGRRPGRRELRALKEEAAFELLPQAFTQRSAVLVWISPRDGWLLLDAGSSSRADAALTALVQAAPALAPRAPQTAVSPSAAMTAWLASGEPPRAFSVDRDGEFKAPDESRSAVRYARHPLDPTEVRRHLDGGLVPTRLALTWADRVSFVLTESMQLKRIALLDLVLDRPPGGVDAGFDADVALATGELGRLLPDLLDALGGEVRPGSA
jgi:recombination associated protein RdgC